MPPTKVMDYFRTSVQRDIEVASARRARAQERWNDAVALRDVLIANGIEVHDDVHRTEWESRK